MTSITITCTGTSEQFSTDDDVLVHDFPSPSLVRESRNQFSTNEDVLVHDFDITNTTNTTAGPSVRTLARLN
jgi:hypothetical protein